jgi:hypothetical protein
MGKAAEETEEVKAQNEDFSKKALRSLGGGALHECLVWCRRFDN